MRHGGTEYGNKKVFDFYDNILEMNIGNHDMKIDTGREITLWGYDLSGNRATAHAIVQNFKEGKAIVEITSDTTLHFVL